MKPVRRGAGERPPPVLASINDGSLISPAFRSAIARDLREQRYQPLGPMDIGYGTNACPVFESRRLIGSKRRGTSSDKAKRTHHILVEWRWEDDIVRLAGLRRVNDQRRMNDDDERFVIADDQGVRVDFATAVARMSKHSIRIASAAFKAPLLEQSRKPELDAFLVAAAAASYEIRYDQIAKITAPTPFAPARMSIVGPHESYEVDVDPAFSDALPHVFELTLLDEQDRIRVDAYQAIVKPEDMPTKFESLRALSALKKMDWT